MLGYAHPGSDGRLADPSVAHAGQRRRHSEPRTGVHGGRRSSSTRLPGQAAGARLPRRSDHRRRDRRRLGRSRSRPRTVPHWRPTTRLAEARLRGSPSSSPAGACGHRAPATWMETARRTSSCCLARAICSRGQPMAWLRATPSGGTPTTTSATPAPTASTPAPLASSATSRGPATASRPHSPRRATTGTRARSVTIV